MTYETDDYLPTNVYQLERTDTDTAMGLFCSPAHAKAEIERELAADPRTTQEDLDVLAQAHWDTPNPLHITLKVGQRRYTLIHLKRQTSLSPEYRAMLTLLSHKFSALSEARQASLARHQGIHESDTLNATSQAALCLIQDMLEHAPTTQALKQFAWLRELLDTSARTLLQHHHEVQAQQREAAKQPD